MVSVSRFVRAAVAALLLVANLAVLAPPAQAAATPVVEFRSAMRRLWEDHVQYTRMFIVGFAADLPDQDATAARLLQNQVDIGNAIKPYYGDAAGDQLTALLKAHILGAVDVLKAAKSGDKAAFDAANAKWYANGNDIADFLAKANPRNWPDATMRDEMKMHLDLTLQEASDRLGGKYAQDVQDYDKVHDEILGMSDALSNGIIAQFPDRFDQTGAGEWATRSAVRKLWEDHITWTRLYVISFAAGLPDQDVTAARLLQNQTDLGDAIKPTFGAAAGDKLTALLKAHILGAVDVLKAAKAGDKTQLDASNAKWYANGNDIAAFLNAANPRSWPLDTMQAAMKKHLDTTLQEASDRLGGKYAQDIQDYDAVHDHILMMADVISTGLLAAGTQAPSSGAQAPTSGTQTPSDAANPQALTTKPQSFALTGSKSGSFAYYDFDYDGSGRTATINVQVSPEDKAALQAGTVGFKVYGPQKGKVYATSGAQPTLVPNLTADVRGIDRGHYVVQVFDYDTQGRHFDLRIWGSGDAFAPAG